MITSEWQNVVKVTHLISKEIGNNKYYVKYVFRKVFENSIKLLKGPFLVMFQNFLIRRALKGELGTQRILK